MTRGSVRPSPRHVELRESGYFKVAPMFAGGSNSIESAGFPYCSTSPLPRARNLVERFFNRIKQFRGLATRYDELAANYLAFIQPASIRLWPRVNVHALISCKRASLQHRDRQL